MFVSLGKTVEIRLNRVSFFFTAVSPLTSCLVSGRKQRNLARNSQQNKVAGSGNACSCGHQFIMHCVS